jgi:hypothetical protein
MGRATYEYFFANWADVSDNPYIEAINAKPKVRRFSIANRGGVECHAPRV